MILIGLSLMAIATVFIWYLWSSFQKARLMDSWVETPCTIESVSIDNSQQTQHYATKYRLDVIYTYRIGEREYRGTRVKRLPVEGSSRKKIEKKRTKYVPTENPVCFVDPEAPENAVLRKDTKAAIYSIWFPGLFFVGGLGIVLSAFLPHRKRP